MFIGQTEKMLKEAKINKVSLRLKGKEIISISSCGSYKDIGYLENFTKIFHTSSKIPEPTLEGTTLVFDCSTASIVAEISYGLGGNPYC